MGAAGVRVVVAESYARIFFRNSIATGEVRAVATFFTDAFSQTETDSPRSSAVTHLRPLALPRLSALIIFLRHDSN